MPKRNAEGLTFEEWRKKVDSVVVKTVGMSMDDLADTIFLHDRWNDCEGPKDTAVELMENDGVPRELLS